MKCYMHQKKNTVNTVSFDNEFRVRKNIYELQEELHLKKFKRHLLANEKNIMSVDEEEITFTNEEKIKL